MKEFLRVLALISSIVVLAACVPFWDSWTGGGSGSSTPKAPKTESRWSVTLKTKNESVPMTVIVAPESSSKTRLLVLSSFGAAMGDCTLSASSTCRTAPGAQPMVEKVAAAVTGMLVRDADFVQNTVNSSVRLSDTDWKATRDSSGNISFQWTTAPTWSLAFKRVD